MIHKSIDSVSIVSFINGSKILIHVQALKSSTRVKLHPISLGCKLVHIIQPVLLSKIFRRTWNRANVTNVWCCKINMYKEISVVVFSSARC